MYRCKLTSTTSRVRVLARYLHLCALYVTLRCTSIHTIHWCTLQSLAYGYRHRYSASSRIYIQLFVGISQVWVQLQSTFSRREELLQHFSSTQFWTLSASSSLLFFSYLNTATTVPPTALRQAVTNNTPVAALLRRRLPLHFWYIFSSPLSEHPHFSSSHCLYNGHQSSFCNTAVNYRYPSKLILLLSRTVVPVSLSPCAHVPPRSPLGARHCRSDAAASRTSFAILTASYFQLFLFP